MSGNTASIELPANEANALRELTDARGQLLAALAEAGKDEQAVVLPRSDGIVVEIRRDSHDGARLTVDLGCCKKSRHISCEEHASPRFDRIVQELEEELIATYGCSRPTASSRTPRT